MSEQSNTQYLLHKYYKRKLGKKKAVKKMNFLIRRKKIDFLKRTNQ